MREKRLLMGKSERKRPVGRLGRKDEDNINLDLWEIRWGIWIRFFWLRVLVNMVMDLRAP
jgi:hypothetical protein